jgi:4-diphosphocytidyl-2-C-methyl-D-erythritol kinase
MVKLLRKRTPAKINLFLRVTGRRTNGYHELDSLFLPISHYDQLDLELRPARTAGIQLFCNSPAIPAGESNLAFIAAREFLREFCIQAEVVIKLDKGIPMGAGLGGGSSDAGAVLRMMAEFCRLGQSAALQPIAMRLGADVPFFLNPVPSRVRGIGERIEPLSRMERTSLLIAVPPFEVLTASVFRDLRPEHWSGPAPEGHVLAIVDGRIEHDQLVNDLERVAIVKWPQIGELKTLIEALGARGAAMTGSGGGVFGIFDSPNEASAACRELARRAPHVRAFTAYAL